MTETAFYDATPEDHVPYQSVDVRPCYSSTFANLTLSDLDRIEPEWEELTTRGDFSDPFFQPYWFRAFMETFHGGKPAPFVLVREGDELKGILPFMRSRRFWGRFPARSLMSLSGIHSCRFDFICESHNKDKIAEAAWRALEDDTSWTVIEAQGVPEGGGFEALMRHADRNGYLVARWPTLLSPYLNVPAGAKDGLQNCPARYRKDRNRVKSKLKKLREHGEVSFEVLEQFDEEFFQEFLRLEGAGWKGKAGGAIRCDDTIVDFYRQMLTRADAKKHVRMCALKLNGKRIAMELALVSNNVCYSPKIAYDEELSKIGPGQIMPLFAIQDLAEKGIAKYDLLGPRARNKALWAGDVRAHANCFIFRPNLIGTAYYLLATRVAPMLRRAKYKRYGDPQSLGDCSGAKERPV
jgi:CelD/BcsL family acetyltransferase involved in cellulose biosynthesis